MSAAPYTVQDAVRLFQPVEGCIRADSSINLDALYNVIHGQTIRRSPFAAPHMTRLLVLNWQRLVPLYWGAVTRSFTPSFMQKLPREAVLMEHDRKNILFVQFPWERITESHRALFYSYYRASLALRIDRIPNFRIQPMRVTNSTNSQYMYNIVPLREVSSRGLYTTRSLEEMPEDEPPEEPEDLPEEIG